jgi:hypothetical protein
MQTLTTLGLLEHDLAFWNDEPFREYRPQFAVEAQGADILWLTDRGHRRALVYKPYDQIDLFEFFPGPPRLAQPELPAVYHAPSMLGAKLTMIQWLNWEQSRSNDTHDLQVEENAESIRLTMRETWPQWGMESVKIFELRVHPRFGYVLYTANDVRADQPVKLEFANFLAAGMAEHRPHKVRFPYVVWRHPTRGLLRWTSNHATTRTFGQMDAADRRQIGRDGWLGMFGEHDWNPVYALESSSQDCAAITCDNLLDEHLHFTGDPARDVTGKCVWQNRGALLAVPGAVANQLSQQATPNDHDLERAHPDRVDVVWSANFPVDPAKPRRPRLCGFSLNKVCDFETTIPLDVCFRGKFWPAQEDVADWAMITTEKARSGQRSLRLRIGRADGERRLGARGASLWLDAGKCYRLSAWVCYAGNAPRVSAFRLVATQIYYNLASPLEMKEVRRTGDQCPDWQRLELEFTALPHDPAVEVEFFVAGEGAFFVDDILLEEQP